MKIFVPHGNAHQKVTSAKKDLNNQVARRTSSVKPVCLFPQPLLSLPNGLVNRVADGCREGDQAWAQHMDLHSSRLTWLRPATADGPMCPQQRPALSPNSTSVFTLPSLCVCFLLFCKFSLS